MRAELEYHILRVFRTFYE